MNKQKAINKRRTRRKLHIRKRVFGSPEKPRLSVYRSNKHIYAQLIDDFSGATLASASTFSKEVSGALGDSPGGGRKAAVEVGKLIADRAKGAGVERVVFDRNGYRFQGRVAELANAAREGGLKL
jgi:large subunit ribosomal protein L18